MDHIYSAFIQEQFKLAKNQDYKGITELIDKLIKIDDISGGVAFKGDKTKCAYVVGVEYKKFEEKHLIFNTVGEEEFWKKNEQGKWFFDVNCFSEWFMNHYHYTNSPMGEYVYRDKKYEQVANQEIDQLIIKRGSRVDHQISNAKVEETHKYLAKIGWKEIDLTLTNNMLNLNNGIYDLKNRILLQHDPKYFFTYKLNWEYDGLAKCPLFDRFLELVMQGRQEDIDLCWTLIADIIYGGKPILEKAWILYGEGKNGKSAFLNIVRALVGEENISSIKMSSIHNLNLATMLVRKMANIVNEIDKKEVSSEDFKTLVSGEVISAKYLYKNPFKFQNTARMIFACNNFPFFNDLSDGIKRRLAFIPFKYTIKDEEKNPYIAEDIARNELPGIFKKALKYMEVLEEKKTVELTTSSKQVLKEYELEADNVAAFVDECVEFNEGATVKNSDLIKKYKNYCEESYLKPKNRVKFFRDFKKHCKAKIPAVVPFKSNRDRGYRNIQVFYLE